MKNILKDLIVTTACLGGHIPTSVNEMTMMQAAEERIDWFLNVLVQNAFILKCNRKIKKNKQFLIKNCMNCSTQQNIHCVAAGDCHYVHADDHEAHEIMLPFKRMIKLATLIGLHLGLPRAYAHCKMKCLRSLKIIQKLCGTLAKLLTVCNFNFETGKLFFPKFEIPEEHTQETYFKYLCNQGFKNY